MSDDWNCYICDIDGQLASIFLNLAYRDEAPLPELVESTRLRAIIQQPRPDGFPADEEANRLHDIEDAIDEAISAADVPIVYVGRCTTGGNRDFFFYSPSGTVAEACISSALVPFADYEFEIGSRPDAEWEGYLEFLFPSPREYQSIMNGRVLMSLHEEGDNPSIAREVVHWIYFTEPAGRQRFAQAAKSKGYHVVSETDDGPGENPLGIRVAHDTTVDYSTINDAVLDLFDLSQECNGDYDGWETSVEK